MPKKSGFFNAEEKVEKAAKKKPSLKRKQMLNPGNIVPQGSSPPQVLLQNMEESDSEISLEEMFMAQAAMQEKEVVVELPANEELDP